MTGSQQDERRRRRAAAQGQFDLLAAGYLDRPEVSRGRMFGSHGLTVSGKFFAFVGGDGQLIIKLPKAQASALITEGHAGVVRGGRNVMREWVAVPASPGDTPPPRWAALLGDAHRYVASLQSAPTRDG